MCSVVCFYEHRLEKTDANLQKCRPCVFSNISTVAFLVGSPLEINNPVPTSPVRFQQFRVNELFVSNVTTSAVIVGHSSNDIEFLLTVLYSVNVVIFGFRKLINAFPFFPHKHWERGPHKWISLGPHIG